MQERECTKCIMIFQPFTLTSPVENHGEYVLHCFSYTVREPMLLEEPTRV